MKQFVILALLALGSLQASAADPVKQHGQLHVEGTQLKDCHKQPVVLRGITLEWDANWSQTYNKKTLRRLKRDMHYNVVRAAVEVTGGNGYLARPQAAMQNVTALIDACIKQNIYIILDWHASEMKTGEAKAFFSQIAQRYGYYPHLIYEIYNQPVEDTWAGIKKYAEEVVGEIRRHAPSGIVVVGCPHWNQDIHLVADSPLKGFQNIMYSVHFFAATHGNTLRERTEEAVRRGTPVFITDSGAMEADGEGDTDAASEQQWEALCSRYGISRISR